MEHGWRACRYRSLSNCLEARRPATPCRNAPSPKGGCSRCAGDGAWSVSPRSPPIAGGRFRRAARRKDGGFFFLVLLATDGTPSGGLDYCPFGGKVATRCGETDGCNVLYATGGEGFEQAGGNHIVHLALVLRQFAGQTFGNNQSMVIGDFSCVHATAVECRLSGWRHRQRKRGIAPKGRCGTGFRRKHRRR